MDGVLNRLFCRPLVVTEAVSAGRNLRGKKANNHSIPSGPVSRDRSLSTPHNNCASSLDHRLESDTRQLLRCSFESSKGHGGKEDELVRPEERELSSQVIKANRSGSSYYLSDTERRLTCTLSKSLTCSTSFSGSSSYDSLTSDAVSHDEDSLASEAAQTLGSSISGCLEEEEEPNSCTKILSMGCPRNMMSISNNNSPVSVQFIEKSLLQYLQERCEPGFFSELGRLRLLNPTFHSMWCKATTVFNVRSKTYLKTGLKEASESSIGSLLHMELFEVGSRTDHLIKHLGSDCIVHHLASYCRDPPFILALNFQIPGKTNVHCIVYWALPAWVAEDLPSYPIDIPAAAPVSAPPQKGAAAAFEKLHLRGSGLHRLLHAFLTTAPPEWRARRLKLIPAVPAGGGPLVRRAVGARPVLLLSRLPHRHFRGARYLEVDCDVGGAGCVARRAVALVRGASPRGLRVELALAVQGEAPGELPERLLGACAFAGLDWRAARPLPPPPPPSGPGAS